MEVVLATGSHTTGSKPFEVSSCPSGLKLARIESELSSKNSGLAVGARDSLVDKH